MFFQSPVQIFGKSFVEFPSRNALDDIDVIHSTHKIQKKPQKLNFLGLL